MGPINGFSVVKLKITPFIAILGVMSIGRGFVLLITHGPIGAIGPAFKHLSRGALGPVPAALIIILLVFIMAALVMNRTAYGRHLFALGGGREVARLNGINVPRVEFSSYFVTGLCSAAAGLYLTSRMGVGDPSVGPGFELDSIIAVLIGGIPFGGGRGNILGVIAGVLLIALLGNLNKVEALMRSAAGLGAELVPETFSTGYGVGARIAEVSDTIPGKVTDRIGELVKELNLYF